MKYCYLRDELGNSMVTIAYEEIEDKVFFGVTALSGEEELITKERGKIKAEIRCAKALSGVKAVWHDYLVQGEVKNDERNTFINLLVEKGIDKIGCMDSESFRDTIKNLCLANRNTPFESKLDAYNDIVLPNYVTT